MEVMSLHLNTMKEQKVQEREKLKVSSIQCIKPYEKFSCPINALTPPRPHTALTPHAYPCRAPLIPLRRPFWLTRLVPLLAPGRARRK